MQNPFPVGIPVQGKNLIGRDEDINAIFQLLNDSQSVVLIAPRRYGKTSILLTVLDKLEQEGNITCDIDLFTIANKRCLAEHIIESVLRNTGTPIRNLITSLKKNIASVMKNVEFKAIVDKFEFVLNLADKDIDDDVLLEESLAFAQTYAVQNKKKLIFAYDEFNEIMRLGGELLLKQMRAKFQRHTHVTYLFAGSQESIMRKMFTGKANAFYRFARVINLGLIDKKSFADYIKSQFKSLGINIGKEETNEILKYTEGHPYYTQLLCQTLYYKIKGDKKIVSLADIAESYKKLFLAERPGYDELIRELTTKKHHLEIILLIANNQNPYSAAIPSPNVNRILNNLEDAGFIIKANKGTFVISDKFFNEYLKMFANFY